MTRSFFEEAASLQERHGAHWNNGDNGIRMRGLEEGTWPLLGSSAAKAAANE